MGKRMKIRLGFVSNSSSVSFCIYGIYVDCPDDEEDEAIQTSAEEMGLYCRSDQLGEGLYVGRRWASIGDNETGRQFKEATQETVNKLPIEDKDKGCRTIQEGWYDG